jgi:hypothetical protein
LVTKAPSVQTSISNAESHGDVPPPASEAVASDVDAGTVSAANKAKEAAKATKLAELRRIGLFDDEDDIRILKER